MNGEYAGESGCCKKEKYTGTSQWPTGMPKAYRLWMVWREIFASGLVIAFVAEMSPLL
jgi:hypothetical protein